MFSDFEITENLLKIPENAPKIVRQYAFNNLNNLNNLNNFDSINDLNNLIKKADNNEDNSYEKINLPVLKKNRSESLNINFDNHIRRINTF
jgi:hypothetical protein